MSEDLEFNFEPPDIPTISGKVEETVKCLQCGGGIRAVVERFEKTAHTGADLDVLFILYCRNAECGWMDTQWRPWSSKIPNDI